MIKTIEVMIMFFRDNTDVLAVFQIVICQRTLKPSLTEAFYACIFMMMMMMMMMMTMTMTMMMMI